MVGFLSPDGLDIVGISSRPQKNGSGPPNTNSLLCLQPIKLKHDFYLQSSGQSWKQSSRLNNDCLLRVCHSTVRYFRAQRSVPCAGNFREFVEIRKIHKNFLNAKICCPTVLEIAIKTKKLNEYMHISVILHSQHNSEYLTQDISKHLFCHLQDKQTEIYEPPSPSRHYKINSQIFMAPSS